MNPTPWKDQKVFWTTLKNQMYPNKASIFVKKKALMVALKHSEGIKHTVLFQ
jgi:hypothetical protein